MKLLWLCNTMPGPVRRSLGFTGEDGLWMDHVLEDLSGQEDVQLTILCLASQEAGGSLSDRIRYVTFTEGAPYEYSEALERSFRAQLLEAAPDAIHIWGTEYAHTLAMMRACDSLGLLDRTAISIQGLCSVIADHYTDGIPETQCARSSFRDFLRKDNILQQQEKFALRGALEKEALSMARHVMGRTDWDRRWTSEYSPNASYHYCAETLRSTFYEGQWRYDGSKKHRIFLCDCSYPIKGFHVFLQALAQVARQYPDVSVCVTGASFLGGGWKAALRRQTYSAYLAKTAKKLGVADKLTFLGRLSAGQMKQAYLDANVFVLSSLMENSPNALGEAMLLGVPCVATRVGGTENMLHAPQEGFLVDSCDAAQMADRICHVFAMGEEAEALGARAAEHARVTHDPKENLRDLLEVYRSLSEGCANG